MTAAQMRLYRVEWAAVQEVVPDADDAYRFSLHRQALDIEYDKSSKDLTQDEFDRVLAAFRAITQPDSLDAQIRQAQQSQTRLTWSIAQYQFQLLSVYVKPLPGDYVLTLILGKFPHVRTAAIGDWRSSLSLLTAKELLDLRNTLAARVQKLRKTAGHTINEMHELAGVKVPGRPEAPF